MCIAILKPANTDAITDNEFKLCWENNDDGCGYAFVALDEETQENYVKVKKFMKFEEFLEEYRKDEKIHIHTPFLIHFRATSAGVNSLENCHPFQIDKDMAFIHNGTMSAMVETKSKYSDTYNFNAKVLQKLPEGWWKNEGICELIDHMVGFSRMVFLRSDMSVYFVNEDKGHYYKGIWWSNNDYKTARLSSYASNNSYQGNYNSSTGKTLKHKQVEIYKCGTRKVRYMYTDGTSAVYDYSDNFDKNVSPIIYKQEVWSPPQKQLPSSNVKEDQDMDDFLMDTFDKTSDDFKGKGSKKKKKLECQFCFGHFKGEEIKTYNDMGTAYRVCVDCYSELEDIMSVA